jgi:hypothetical protein
VARRGSHIRKCEKCRAYSKGFGVWGATLDESGTKDFKTTKARDLKCRKTLQHIAAPELGLVESELGVQGCSLVKAAAQRHQRDHAENRSQVGTGYQVPALLLLSTYLLQD